MASQGNHNIRTGTLRVAPLGSSSCPVPSPEPKPIVDIGDLSGNAQSGRSGYSGFSGFQGDDGDQGISGFSGRSGRSGYSGQSGQSGFSGNAGGSGPSGISGESGYSGTSSWSGISGFSGAAGAGIQEKNIYNTFSSSYGTMPYTVKVGRSSCLNYKPIGTYALDFHLDIPEDFVIGNDAHLVLNYNMSTSSASNIVLKLDVDIIDLNGDADPLVPTYTTTDIIPVVSTAYINTEYIYTLSSSLITDIHQSIRFTLSRLSDDASDTHAGDFNVENVSFRYIGFGAAAALGYSGFSGFSGINGIIGVDGVSGYSGFSGLNGIIGVDGVSGFSGFSGVGLSGFSGEGFSGPSGFSGYSGQSANSGISGISGFSGFSGFGPSGFSGYSGSGLSGYSGRSGTSGTSGTSGFSGISGVSGFSSLSGTSGTSGFSGTFSGFSGYSGTSGVSGFSGTVVGTSEHISIVKEFDEPRTATTILPDSELFAVLEGGASYILDGMIKVSSASATPDFAFYLTYSATMDLTSSWVRCSLDNATTIGTPSIGNGTNAQAFEVNFNNSTWMSIQISSTVDGGIQLNGRLKTITPGFFSLEWGQLNTDLVNPTTVRAGSYFQLIKGSGALSGFSGFSGNTGISGYSGFSGTFSGFSGFSGLGISGQSGESGASGASGFSGAFSGISGFSGVSGFSGLGYSGPSGPSGISGYSGESGTSGFSGAFSGISGFSGFSGQIGSGLSGYSGATGGGYDPVTDPFLLALL